MSDWATEQAEEIVELVAISGDQPDVRNWVADKLRLIALGAEVRAIDRAASIANGALAVIRGGDQ